MLTTLLILLLICVIVAIFAVSLIVSIIQTRGVPFVSTKKKDIDAILTAMAIKPGEKIYDLGCGKASLLIKAAKKYGAQGVGYEISLWPYIWAKFNVWRSGAPVKIHFKNFFSADLSDAKVVFCYLMPNVMAKLELKFKKELRPNSRVISYGFKLPNLVPEKIIETSDENRELNKIFIYYFLI